jgi:hypothetical protein
MRRDRTKGALEYIPELTWMMFLRILDEKEHFLNFVNNELIPYLKSFQTKPSLESFLLQGK